MTGNIFAFYTVLLIILFSRPQTIKRPLNPLASSQGELVTCIVTLFINCGLWVEGKGSQDKWQEPQPRVHRR